MRAARRWLRRQRRGTERAGLVASSSAQWLKPHAIDIRANIDPVHWFLSPPRDTRSSLYLEDAATEFQVQGMELDWPIVTWDADLRWRGSDRNSPHRSAFLCLPCSQKILPKKFIKHVRRRFAHAIS
jgi:hypothetical protein